VHDIGEEGLAQAYYGRALQLATESDPVAHAAWTLRISAHQSLDLGRPRRCQALATTAWDMVRGRIEPAGEALFAITAARAHAANGQRSQTVEAIARAEHALDTGDEQTPRWARITGPPRATVASHTAKSITDLGDHAAAEAQYATAAAARDPAGYRRIHALTLTQLARSQAAQGHADQACASWSTALDHMPGISSTRHRNAIATMRTHLATFARRGVPGATDLAQRGTHLLTTQRP
jgi:tetratricopeptide (TPR) repeat protein